LVENRDSFIARQHTVSNGVIFNDLELPLPPISRWRHSLTLNISGTVRDTDIPVVSMEF